MFPSAFLSISRAQKTSPIVLEAYSTLHGSGPYREKRLFVRLASDGKVEWETPRWGKPNELHSTAIAADRVLAIRQRLEAVDPQTIEARMGPFEIYTDTSIELQITVNTPTWNRRFVVINPWQGKVTRMPLSKDLKIIVCEVSQLRAQMADEQPAMVCAQ